MFQFKRQDSNLPDISILCRVFNSQLTLRQLTQPDLESRFVTRTHLAPNIQTSSFSCGGLPVVTQSTYLLKSCYPKLVLNLHCSKILPQKQLECRCIPLNPRFWKKQIFKYRFSISGIQLTFKCLMCVSVLHIECVSPVSVDYQ